MYSLRMADVIANWFYVVTDVKSPMNYGRCIAIGYYQQMLCW